MNDERLIEGDQPTPVKWGDNHPLKPLYMDLGKGRQITSPRTIIPLGIVYNYCYHHFWIRFRIIGWRGIAIKDIRLYPLLFSERSGFTRVLLPRLWWALVVLRKPYAVSPRWTGEDKPSS